MKFLIPLASLLLLATPASASDRLVEVAAWYVWLQPTATGTFVAGTPEEPFDLRLSSETGYGASAALFFGRRVSLELAAAQVNSSASLAARGRTVNLAPRQATFYPLSGTLQFHFRPMAMIDPYLGVGAMHVLSGNLTGGRQADLSVEEIESSGTAYLVNAGFNIELTEQLAVLIDSKWVPSPMQMRTTLNNDPASTSDIEISPLLVSIGISYRWGR